jgi:hypothetical protein
VVSSAGDGVWTGELTLPDDAVFAVWTPGPGSAFACTADGYFYSSNGAGAWSSGTLLDSTVELLCLCVWGTSPTNIYVGTTNGIYHGTAN